MSGLTGTVSQAVLLNSLNRFLSAFDESIVGGRKKYESDLDNACEIVRTQWASRATMKEIWISNVMFLEEHGSKTEEYKQYLNSSKYTFVPALIRPEVTHVMLESDWDKFWLKVVARGADYINTIQEGKDRLVYPYRVRLVPNERCVITDMLIQNIDVNHMNVLFNSITLRHRFTVLLNSVSATTLENVTLDDKSLELIQNIKSNTVVLKGEEDGE